MTAWSGAPPQPPRPTLAARTLRAVATGADTGTGVDAAAAPDRARSGPFAAAEHRFVLESNQPWFLESVADRLRDLRVHGAFDGDEPSTTVFRIDRTGPAWLSHPWGIWRDGEPCETTVTEDYVRAYTLWEVTRLVLERAAPRITAHAAAVAHDGRALVLAGKSHAGKSTLAAWLTARGWGFLTDEVALLDVDSAGGRADVHPFWRPIGVRRGGPLDAVVNAPSGDAEVLIPASELGPLAGPAPLHAFVLPSYEPGATGALERISPAAVLANLCGHLPSLHDRGRVVFRAMATLVESVPGYRLAVDDLDQAEARLRELVEGSG